MKTIAIISIDAFSLINFREPLIKSLVLKGVRVYALAPDYTESSRQKIISFGAEPVEYLFSRNGTNPIRDGVNTIKLALLLRNIHPDIFFGYFIKPVIFGTIAAWAARVPHRLCLIAGLGYVFTDDGEHWTLRHRFLRMFVLFLYRVALRHAEWVIFQNPDDSAEFVKLGVVDSARVVHIGGTGVDLEAWPLMTCIEKPITFLLAGRLLREKGIREYAEAARKVKQKYPEVRFILLGDYDSNPSCLKKNEVQSWVDEGLLEWPGHVPVRPWLAQASVYVLPSYREGVPRSTQEAMAMGRAIITTDVPGCRETVHHGINGFLVPVRDTDALGNAMCRFIDDPSLILKMGIESRKMAEERFDVHVINSQFLRLFGVS